MPTAAALANRRIFPAVKPSAAQSSAARTADTAGSIRRPLGKVGKEGNAILSEGALQRDAIGRKIPADYRDLLVAQSPPAHVLTDGSSHRRNLLIGIGGPDQGDPLPRRFPSGSGTQEVLLHPPESLALEPQRALP